MTDADDYKKQRLDGVKLIDEEIRKVANEYDIKGVEVEWDRGGQIIRRKFHILKISSQGITVETRIKDDNLADFHSVVGTEIIKGIIRTMIIDLKHNLK